MTSPSVARLVQQVHRLADLPGRVATALPDLWFLRAEAPLAYRRAHSATMNLSFAASGRKIVTTGGRTATSDATRYLVMHGGRHYEAQVEASRETPYIALKLQIPPAVLGRTLLDLVDLGAAGPCTAAPSPVFVGQLDDVLALPLSRLLDSLDDPVERAMVAPLCFREIAFRLLRSDAAAPLRASITRDHLRILAAIRHVEAEPAQPTSVQDLARIATMSPSHFAHRFREFASMSPMQYVKLMRLEKARLLLLEAHSPVALVAEHAGYASLSHFARDFRRQFGVSAASYSAAIRGRKPLTAADSQE